MTGKEVESGANKRSTNSEPAEADDRNIEVDEKTSTNVTEPTMSNPRPTIHVFKHDRLRRVDLTSDTPKTRFHLPTSTRSNPSLSHVPLLACSCDLSLGHSLIFKTTITDASR